MSSLRCILRGGCSWTVHREEWLPADENHKTIRLLRFYVCTHCPATLASITSPDFKETTCSGPDTNQLYFEKEGVLI